jgi:hypothetical protein
VGSAIIVLLIPDVCGTLVITIWHGLELVQFFEKQRAAAAAACADLNEVKRGYGSRC